MHVAAPLDPSLPNMYDDLERGPKTGGGRGNKDRSCFRSPIHWTRCFIKSKIL